MYTKEKISSVYVYALVLAIFVVAMVPRLGPELADDAAFFLRYAENIVTGEFWVWNKGEAPIWGASAPLYPLLVAMPLAFGSPPFETMVWVGIALAACGLAFAALLLFLHFGIWAGFAFVVFTALDTGAMYFSGSGLETPLTFVLLALGLWVVLGNPKPWVAGMVAGLLMVHKLDLVPAGGLLLVAYWLKTRRVPFSAFVCAVAIVLLWYGFAWWYFGIPVPNSFLTKAIFQADHPTSINWRWFAGFVLLVSIHKWLVGLSLIAATQQGRRLFPTLIFLAGLLAIHLIAYTIKFPFEPYNWYGMPSVFALLVLGSIGVHGATQFTSQWFPKRVSTMAAFLVPLSLVTLILAIHLGEEIRGTNNIKTFAANQEHDRAEAGRWVDQNTPKDFTVYTMWGNPAYYSRRQVIDGSFLNRRFESGNLIKKYRPEIIVLQNNPGSTPMDPVFAATKGEGYRVVKVFDKTFTNGMDYFFAVLAREDVLGRITNIDPPKNLLRFVQKVQLGDHFGLLKAQGSKTLFVHPGLKTPTRFQFDVESYLREWGQKTFKLEAMMAPNVPEESIKRGAANVKVVFLGGGKSIAEAVVKVGEPFRKEFTISDAHILEIIVDNNGNPDTDWLLVSID